MADLSYVQATLETKIIGQDSAGNNANYVTADSNGNMAVKDFADGTPGSAVPTVTTLVGGSDGTNLRTFKTDTSGDLFVVGNVASGASDSGNPVKTGAVFNSTLPVVTNGQRVDSQADSNGRIIVTNVPLDGSKASYSAAIVGLVVANTPTDIFTITGSSTKTIRITFVEITGTETNATVRDVVLLKRSTANSGGTSTTQTAVASDSNNAAATATVRAYTVNPTLGTLVGNIRARKADIDITSKSGPIELVSWVFGERPSQAIVLRGTSEVVSVNLNSITSAGNSFDVGIEWTEE